MVTRSDVAKYAGVSPATVSNVINKKEIVSEEAAARVMEAIKVLGYRPNMVARSLKTKETMQIALVSNDITNQYYAEVALGMEDEAKKFGYLVCMINAENSVVNLDELEKRQFDGIIIATEKIPEKNINSLAQMNIPVVFVGNEGYKSFDKEITQVHIDIYGGACQLFRYLVEQGHKRIGFISSRPLKSLEEPDYRMKAYMDILDEAYIHVDRSLIFCNGESMDYAFSSALKMLTRSDRPTAVFTGNDNMALAVMAAASKIGLNIPGDLSIAGFDNLNSSKYYTPALTTVDMPKFKLGQRTMELLLRKIRDEKADDIVLGTELVIRDSVLRL